MLIFFILNAGFDQAAPNSNSTMEEYKFLQQMNFEVPGIFNKLDGWASHSYPNHGYTGKPWETGKASVKGYEWELLVLKNNFGLKKDLPVFITETGWPRSGNSKLITSGYLEQAFTNVWLPDKRVAAVTPFILNYPEKPFNNFSWFDSQGNPYPQYETIKQLLKVAGQPEQIKKIEIVSISFPSFIPANNTFIGKITLKNTGQSIWGEKLFRLLSLPSPISPTSLILPDKVIIKPDEKYSFDFKFSTPSTAGEYLLSWQGLPEYRVTVFEAWKLTNTSQTFFNRLVNRITNFWYNFLR